jgi:hypothetical protein
VVRPATATEGLDFEALPTFDDLRDQSGLKTAQLRRLLASVPCWRCRDNSVRYDAEAAAAALARPWRSAELGALEGDDDDDDDDDDEPPKRRPRYLRQADENARISAALSKQALDVMRAMGEPLRQGLELWKASSLRQEARLEKHEANFDRMTLLIQELLTAQNDREIAKQRAEAAADMRKRSVALLESMLPSLVEKWGLTAQASLALELVGSLDPQLIAIVLESGTLTEKQTAILQQLRTQLAKRAPAPAASEPPKGESNGSTTEEHESPISDS